MKLTRRYMEYHGPNQVMLNVDGLSIYTKTYVTRDNDQNRQVYYCQEELKVRRTDHEAKIEQDAVNIG